MISRKDEFYRRGELNDILLKSREGVTLMPDLSNLTDTRHYLDKSFFVVNPPHESLHFWKNSLSATIADDKLDDIIT